jgi:glycosyltransferase involved in cell wall biosynthesis
MKRILILIKTLGWGGAERLVVNSARHVDRSLFALEIAYVDSAYGALVPYIESQAIPVHCLNGGKGLRWINSLRRLVAERETDLVHAHLPVAGIGARIALAGKPSVPLVYTEHAIWSSYSRTTYWANAVTFPRNDFVFAVADHVRDSIDYPWAHRIGRLPPIETLYHGPDTNEVHRLADSCAVRSELGVPDDAPLVGTVGNLRQEKGHDHLLTAAIHVKKRLPDARFVLVGSGPEESRLIERARRLEIDSSVIFTGYREDALRISSAFDLFVLPSLSEGLSIALVEAMSLGKASVVSRTGGLIEVVRDNEHALLVSPGDPLELAEAIVRLLRDDAQRERLGNAALQRSRDFDIRKAVVRMEEVYEELLA